MTSLDYKGKRLSPVDKIVSGLKKFANDLETESMWKCVKCSSVFGLYIHKGCHWCPKCLSDRILIIEDLLREKNE